MSSVTDKYEEPKAKAIKGPKDAMYATSSELEKMAKQIGALDVDKKLPSVLDFIRGYSQNVQLVKEKLARQKKYVADDYFTDGFKKIFEHIESHLDKAIKQGHGRISKRLAKHYAVRLGALAYAASTGVKADGLKGTQEKIHYGNIEAIMSGMKTGEGDASALDSVIEMLSTGDVDNAYSVIKNSMEQYTSSALEKSINDSIDYDEALSIHGGKEIGKEINKEAANMGLEVNVPHLQKEFNKYVKSYALKGAKPVLEVLEGGGKTKAKKKQYK